MRRGGFTRHWENWGFRKLSQLIQPTDPAYGTRLQFIQSEVSLHNSFLSSPSLLLLCLSLFGGVNRMFISAPILSCFWWDSSILFIFLSSPKTLYNFLLFLWFGSVSLAYLFYDGKQINVWMILVKFERLLLSQYVWDFNVMYNLFLLGVGLIYLFFLAFSGDFVEFFVLR